MSDATLARGPDYAQGYDDAMERVRRLLDAGQQLAVLTMAAALVDTDLAVDTAILLMGKASPLPADKRGEAGDAAH